MIALLRREDNVLRRSPERFADGVEVDFMNLFTVFHRFSLQIVFIKAFSSYFSIKRDGETLCFFSGCLTKSGSSRKMAAGAASVKAA